MTYPYGMKDLPRVTALPRLGLPRATPINNRANGRLKTLTFTTNDTWVAPRNVRMLEKVSGKGSDGVEGSYSPETLSLLTVNALPGTNPTGVGPYTAAFAYSAFSDETDKFIGSGKRRVTYRRSTYNVGTDNLITGPSSTPSVSVNGPRISAEFGDSSGLIRPDNAANQYVRVTIETLSGGSNGIDATGLGLTFPGGERDITAAPVTTFEKVAVTPDQSYPIVVPSGGYVTISYFE